MPGLLLYPQKEVGFEFETKLLTWVELRGFEPLTFCMPCTRVSSEAVPLSLFLAGQSVAAV
jgi:hypothetical protein